MTASRREFLQIVLAGAVQPVAPLRWSTPVATPDTPPYKVIFDHRFPDSVAFAETFNRLGTPVHGISGDVTALWYDALYFDWRAGKAPLAGLTTPDSLFCLEILARDAGLRVTERTVRADGLVSWTIGAQART